MPLPPSKLVSTDELHVKSADGVQLPTMVSTLYDDALAIASHVVPASWLDEPISIAAGEQPATSDGAASTTEFSQAAKLVIA